MRNVLVAAFCGMMLVGMGCRDENGNWGMHKKDRDMDNTDRMSTAKDDCAMCPGVQKASSDGTCPKCKMKL